MSKRVKYLKQVSFRVDADVIDRFQELYPGLNNPAAFTQLINDFEAIKKERDELQKQIIEIAKLGVSKK